MICIDLSQTVISSCTVQLHNELKRGDRDQNKLLIKHMTFNTILGLKKKFNSTHGSKVVLACDSKDYWRRDYFPPYKGHRKFAKAKSDQDWDMIYEAVNEIKADLREYFPYHVVEVPKAEADDVIACLAKYSQTADLTQVGLFEEEPEPFLAVSRDGDFKQLQKWSNVSQWSIIDKKMLKEPKPEKYLLNHIIVGDAGDNIPSVLNGDDWAKARAEGKSLRAAPMKDKRLQSFLINGAAECVNESEKRNWARNENLVSFEKIPANIYKSIIDEYVGYEVKGNKTKLMSYFSKNRMKQLFSELDNF